MTSYAYGRRHSVARTIIRLAAAVLVEKYARPRGREEGDGERGKIDKACSQSTNLQRGIFGVYDS